MNSDQAVTALIFTGMMCLIFLSSLALTIFSLVKLRKKKPPQDVSPNTKITMYAQEEIFLGPGPNIRERLIAMRALQRRYLRQIYYPLFVIGVCFSLISFTFMLLVIAGFYMPKILVLYYVVIFVIDHGEVIYFPIMVLMALAVLVYGWFGMKMWIEKNQAPIIVRNTSNETLKVYLSGRFIGQAFPDSQVKNRIVPSGYGSYLVEAKTPEGVCRYSQELSLQSLNNVEWIVTIPQHQ